MLTLLGKTARAFELEIPPHPAFQSLVRLLQAGIASRMGFAVDALEQIKDAVQELFLYLCQSGSDESIHIIAHCHDDLLQIEISQRAGHRGLLASSECSLRQGLAMARVRRFVDRVEYVADASEQAFRLTRLCVPHE